MGPMMGMSPYKMAEVPGQRAEQTGLRALPGAGTLPEAESAASPRATSLDGLDGSEGGVEDEELTNLNWLHENLLQNFTLGGPEAPPSGSPHFGIEGDGGLPPAASSHSSSDSPSSSSPSCSSLPRGQTPVHDSLKSKPPYSFSLLIYMAIDQSPHKSLPVKDIYGWILEHFPYFSSAPTGWKNSVRHNLSLNKCFRKVDKSLGKVSGKGSLWCVDPKHRPNLLQALKKQRLPTGHCSLRSPPSASSPPRHLLLHDQCYSVKESDFDAASTMMLLNSAHKLHPEPYGRDGLINLSHRDLLVVSGDPKQDHNYSSASQQLWPSRSSSAPQQLWPSRSSSAPQQLWQSHSRSSSLAAQDESSGLMACKMDCCANSEGFHSTEDSNSRRDHGHCRRRARSRCSKLTGLSPGHATEEALRKRARLESRAEVDEELKEAAGSLLHLAGICTTSESSKHRGRSRKLWRK